MPYRRRAPAPTPCHPPASAAPASAEWGPLQRDLLGAVLRWAVAAAPLLVLLNSLVYLWSHEGLALARAVVLAAFAVGTWWTGLSPSGPRAARLWLAGGAATMAALLVLVPEGLVLGAAVGLAVFAILGIFLGLPRSKTLLWAAYGAPLPAGLLLRHALPLHPALAGHLLARHLVLAAVVFGVLVALGHTLERHLRSAVQGRAEALLQTETTLAEAGRRVDERAERLRRTEAELRSALERVEELSRRDELTGLCNRRHFLELARHEWTRAGRTGEPMSLCLVDVDHLRGVNDRHGHAAGDGVLREVARRLGATLRASDVAARFGGEEFVVLLPGTPTSAAVERVAERIRARMEDAPFVVPTGDLRLTVSIGVAGRTPEMDGVEELIARAEERLYAAKGAGRNRVVPLPAESVV